MMEYSPGMRRGSAATIAFLGLLLSSVIAYLGIKFDKMYLGAVFAFTFLLFSMQILFRFCFTRYVYVLDGRNLTVYTGLGKKENRVFDLSLLLVCATADKKQGRKLKKSFGTISRRFNACQNLFPKEKLYIVYNNGLRMAVVIECSKEFADEIKKLIPSHFV